MKLGNGYNRYRVMFMKGSPRKTYEATLYANHFIVQDEGMLIFLTGEHDEEYEKVAVFAPGFWCSVIKQKDD